MNKVLSVFLVALAATASSQTLTYQQTEFRFVSLERAQRVADDVGSTGAMAAPNSRAERAPAPKGQKFVVVRFALPSAPPSNPQHGEATLIGSVPGKGEPQVIKCVETVVWVPVNGTWWAAFVFRVPDETSLLSFHLEKNQSLDLTGMGQAAAKP